jgi:hypothetical protein
MKEQGIEYGDILDSDACRQLTPRLENVRLSPRLELSNQSANWLGLYRQHAPGDSQQLRVADMPKSYDTAFFMAHNMKIIEARGKLEITTPERSMYYE